MLAFYRGLIRIQSNRGSEGSTRISERERKRWRKKRKRERSRARESAVCYEHFVFMMCADVTFQPQRFFLMCRILTFSEPLSHVGRHRSYSASDALDILMQHRLG